MLYFYWTALALSFLVPQSPCATLGQHETGALPGAPPAPQNLALFVAKDPTAHRGNQPPSFLFPSSRTGSGLGGRATRPCESPAECPHSRWGAAAPVPRNSVVGGGWGREQRVWSTENQGVEAVTGEYCFLDLTLRDPAVNEQNHMYPDIHCGIKRESKTLETLQLPTNGGTVHVYMGILPREEKGGRCICENLHKKIFNE